MKKFLHCKIIYDEHVASFMQIANYVPYCYINLQQEIFHGSRSSPHGSIGSTTVLKVHCPGVSPRTVQYLLQTLRTMVFCN